WESTFPFMIVDRTSKSRSTARSPRFVVCVRIESRRLFRFSERFFDVLSTHIREPISIIAVRFIPDTEGPTKILSRFRHRIKFVVIVCRVIGTDVTFVNDTSLLVDRNAERVAETVRVNFRQ